MDDYSFSPDAIRLHAGQTVTIRLRNEGSKMHEFMAGRNVQVHENLTEGFGEDFFAGIDVEISGPGMVMGMEGEGMQMDMGGEEMDMSGDDHDGEGDEHDEEMEMGEVGTEEEDAMEEMEMDEAGDEHDEEMEMGGMGTEEEDAMEEMAGEHEAGGGHAEEEGIVAGRFGVVQMPLMDAHAGLMVMIDPEMIPAEEVTTMTFTVPEDKVGTWEFGCFQERGQHYDDGMNGLIIVEP
jgi:plastocyanin